MDVIFLQNYDIVNKNFISSFGFSILSCDNKTCHTLKCNRVLEEEIVLIPKIIYYMPSSKKYVTLTK
jgi:hypothetical protein